MASLVPKELFEATLLPLFAGIIKIFFTFDVVNSYIDGWPSLRSRTSLTGSDFLRHEYVIIRKSIHLVHSLAYNGQEVPRSDQIQVRRPGTNELGGILYRLAIYD